MSQSSQIGAVPDGTGQEVLDNFNEVGAAVASMSAGNSAPTNPVVAQWWWDLDDGIIKRRNTANTAWEFIENVGATTPPGVTDDSAAGYVIGSRWLDTSGLSVWVLEDPAAGAAVWVQVGSGSGSGGTTIQTGTGTNSADILPNETAVVVTTVTGAPGVTAGTYRPQPAETDDVTAEPGACWISGTDEVSVRVENTGSSTISASALTVTSYAVSK